MSTLRSPPGRGSSQPDLSMLNAETTDLQHTLFRAKRKYPEHECISSEQFADFRKEMTSILRDFVESQNKVLGKISDDVSVIKEEIKNLQLTIQNIITEHNKLKFDVTDLEASQVDTKEKIDKLEANIEELKTKSDNKSIAVDLSCDEIFSELQERHLREKNLVIVGVPEAKGENSKQRYTSDMGEIIKIIKKSCPDPIQVRRIGKYNHKKTRPIKEGYFPDSLKLAKVTPVYKSGPKHEPGNYRPISVLPTISKVFEKILHKRLSDYLILNKHLYEHQYGFRSKSNTLSASIDLITKLKTSIDQKHIALGVFIDLKKAFDSKP
ncbi:unnamed protein product [Parnassius mnemosyne]|uniref:Reverse transcriptase domain-containing protein n=1 Tax=Parnassius mnemosyne TaxID=213953 RepID=A0AAV1M0G4_9NEOP